MDHLYPYDISSTFSTDERCDINELLNVKSDENCSIAKATVDIGISTQLHAVKGTIERYVILEGQGEVEINHQAPQQVNYLDVVSIPTGQPQKITNTGTKPLVFLCICTPRFRQENYINLEEDKYIPVSCELHSELELAIMHKKQLEIKLGPPKYQLLTVNPVDVITKDMSEYLLAIKRSGKEVSIRLDRISSYKII